MSPSIAPVAPEILRRVVEKEGYKIEDDSPYNWTLYKKNSSSPIIIIPKKGNVVSIDVMMNILDRLKMDNKKFFDLCKEVIN